MREVTPTEERSCMRSFAREERIPWVLKHDEEM